MNIKLKSNMIVTKQPIPNNLQGRVVKDNSNFKPLFPNLDGEQFQDDNIPVIQERDELSSFPSEDRVDIDNRKVINCNMDRQEPFVKIKNNKKLALLGESSKLNSCARSRSMTNI